MTFVRNFGPTNTLGNTTGATSYGVSVDSHKGLFRLMKASHRGVFAAVEGCERDARCALLLGNPNNDSIIVPPVLSDASRSRDTPGLSEVHGDSLTATRRLQTRAFELSGHE